MVAKITVPLSISRALNYNEQKVQKGKAACLFAANFLHHANELNFYQKLERFERLMEQNASKTNALHISLNFHPTELLSKEKLIEIAETYINKIGFGKQPFIVYQHHDAAHPHLHIVTTSIQENGKRIDTFNIGRNQSQKARKEIEEAFGLVKATGRNTQLQMNIHPVNVQRVKYGLAETKRSIATVLSVVVNQYRFTSIAELNAVLKLYNVIADPGSEESRTYKHHGLHYRLVDENGTKVGVPIKASSIYCKPTLKFLEEKFAQNQSLRLPFKSKLKTAIDWTLLKQPADMNDFALQLKKEHITAVIRRNDQGFVYGITFIDHRNKTVFNGSDLGKSYSAAGIKEKIAKSIQEEKTPAPNLLEKKTDVSDPQKEMKQDYNQEHKVQPAKESLWDLLMMREKNELRVPFDFIKKKKKRRERKL
jgi:hypothetical protein